MVNKTMEKAGYICRTEHLSLLDESHQRVYFGNEFCERLIPGREDLQQVAAWADSHSLPLTLVTPYVTDEGLRSIRRLLEEAGKLNCLDEVVFNDWGVLTLLEESGERFAPVLGRLLTKQKRGPRILNMMEKVPPAMLAHFRRTSADSESFSSFLRQRGISRIELDNLLQGIERTSDTPASLHIPYAYVSTTRYCLTAYAGSENPYFRKIEPCDRQCRRYSFELRNRGMPVILFLKGNTYFFKNPDLPDNPEKLRIDRIVESPVIPM